jgi:hypothetical protein
MLLATPSFDAHAGAAEAEQYRLQVELENLARKSAWPGVDRTFKELEALGLPLSLADYLLGAQAAIQGGDLFLGLSRVQIGLAASTADEDPNSPYSRAKELATSIESRFGQVRISLGTKKTCIPVLMLSPLPFAEDERVAFEQARKRIQEDRSFTGLLPAGSYKIDTNSFSVEAGQPMQAVDLCKEK